MVLGVGPDGHVASLFPHHPAAATTGAIAVAVHDSPKPPPARVSLTRECLERSREVWFLVSGADKADAVRRGVDGRPVRDHPGRPRARRSSARSGSWTPTPPPTWSGERAWASSTGSAGAATTTTRPAPTTTPSATDGEVVDGVAPVEEIGIRRLTAEEEAALEAVRAGYAEHGIDPADLDDRRRGLRPGPGRGTTTRTPPRSSSCSAPRSATTSWRRRATAGSSAPTRSAPTSPSSRRAAASPS